VAYGAFRRGSHISAIGLATSEDGITWTRFPGNPVLTSADTPLGVPPHVFELVYVDNTFLLYVELGTDDFTDIWLATHQGALP
jgi:hypothetical protein